MTEAIKLVLQKALTEAKCQNQQLSNSNQTEQRLTEIALCCTNLLD